MIIHDVRCLIHVDGTGPNFGMDVPTRVKIKILWRRAKIKIYENSAKEIEMVLKKGGQSAKHVYTGPYIGNTPGRPKPPLNRQFNIGTRQLFNS